MATPLPEKIYITGKNIDPENFVQSVRGSIPSATQRATLELSPDDLTPEARVKYDAYYAEKNKRLDPSQPGVAQDALDCWEELRAAKRSKDELWSVYGYSPTNVLKKAIIEEQRLIKELQTNPSKDVVERNDVCVLKTYVIEKYNIEEYVKPVGADLEFEPEPNGEPEVVVVEK